MLKLETIQFTKTIADTEHFPRDGKTQICFAGRSNVGKSSCINCLANRKSLARTSATPGKTANINLYETPELRISDLPGYGYARVSTAERKRWADLIDAYFKSSERISLGILLADLRRDPTPGDIAMADCFRYYKIPFITVLNKCDKVKPAEYDFRAESARKALQLCNSSELIIFSSITKYGRDELIHAITRAVEV